MFMLTNRVYAKAATVCKHCRVRHRGLMIIQTRRYDSGKPIPDYPKLIFNNRIKVPNENPTELDKVIDSLEGKILYSSYFVAKNVGLRWKVRAMKKNTDEIVYEPPVPLFHKHIAKDEMMNGNFNVLEDRSLNNTDQKKVINFPYNRTAHIETAVSEEELSVSESDADVDEPLLDISHGVPDNQHWMSDYECYDEEEAPGYEEEIDHEYRKYGTSDSSIPISNVPCGGCGALLHCQNPSVPGYIPKELFTPCKEDDLRSIVCQRCHFMKEYNTALSVNVDPSIYPKLIEQIKDKRAMIILMVDMTDFPCSIWPGIFDLIGENKTVVVVGNKIDLIPGDCPGWIKQAEKALRAAVPANINAQHVALISAKTGFGIESLVTRLYKLWQTKGDVYLVGCTNVGKSTLFNALLRSDYCKEKAQNLIQRATTSQWPGTTVNLLKFPIMRPSGWRMYLRTVRLCKERDQLYLERKILKEHNKAIRRKNTNMPVIMEHIGRTFQSVEEEKSDDIFGASETRFKSQATSGKCLNEGDPSFARSRWLYDTPGVINPDQIINLLTVEELRKVVTPQVFMPDVFSVRPDQTLFIGGIARIDVLDGDDFVRAIVYHPSELPITMCYTEHAEEIYDKLVGTEVLGVPYGGSDRLKHWPNLKSAPEIQFAGINPRVVCCEVVLSNAGWVSFTARENRNVVLRLWTPEAKGIYKRVEPLLTYSPMLRRKRIKHTPTYKMKCPFEFQTEAISMT